MIVAERVIEEGPTLIHRPGSDDIAGQKVTRAAWIILGEVLRKRSEFLRIPSSQSSLASWVTGFYVP